MFISGNISVCHWWISVTSYHHQQILFSNTDGMWTDPLGSLTTERHVIQTNWRRSGKQCENVLRARKRDRSHCNGNSIITTRKRSCGKVMFLHLSVILFRGGIHDVTSCRNPSPQDGIPSPPCTVGKRVVRILLECFLVSIIYFGVVKYWRHKWVLWHQIFIWQRHF